MALPVEVSQRVLRKAYLSRRVEEAFLELFAQGKLSGTVHTCIGQEFSGAVVSEFVEPGDAVFSNHRCHGHFLSIRGDVLGLVGEVVGKKIGMCSGIGGSQHLCQGDFYSNGIQGSILPVAAGLGLARKWQKKSRVSFAFVGDGTLGEGALYETLNLVAKWEIPLVVVLENNGYAQSTSSEETLAGNITARAGAFGIHTAMGNTWEWEKLYFVAGEMVHFARTNQKPVFLQIDTFRLKAHSKGDDNRPRSLVEPYEKRDPLTLSLADAKLSVTTEAVDKEVKQAVETALAANVLEKMPSSAEPNRVVAFHPHTPPKKSTLAAINESFHQIMAADEKVVFIGEDVVSPYGGAFKVSQGLSDRFPSRVRNTPISESAIVGLGTGLAMEGFRPFVEIMFGDFLGLAFDQILNSAAKFETMYEAVSLNPVIRTPMGGGRGYGPTHSQSLDRHFVGIPGLRVLALNNLCDPFMVYRALAREKTGPTLLLENKIQYGQPLRETLPAGFERKISDEMFPTIHVAPNSVKCDVTLVGYGGIGDLLVGLAEKLFEEHDIVAQVLCPTQIYPFSVEPFLEILEKAPRVFIVEEGQGFAGFGAELVAQLSERGIGIKTKRLSAEPTCIPAARVLENQVLPTKEKIIAQLKDWIHGN